MAALVLLSLYPAASAAQSASDPFTLSWQAPDSCPDQAALTERVEGFLGQSLEVRRAQQLKIDAVVQADATAGFVARLSVTTAEATYERHLDHRDCARLTEAAALVMALAIDPERVRSREAEAGPGTAEDTPVAPSDADSAPVAPAAPPVPASSPAPPAPDVGPAAAARPVAAPAAARPVAAPPGAAPPASPTDANPLRIDVGVRGLLDFGTLPRAGFGIGGVVGIARGALRLELTGAYWFPVDESVPDHPPAQVEVRLATGGLRGCGVAVQGVWDLAACAGAELGDYRGRGVDVDDPVTQHQRWSAVVADLRVSRALTPVLAIVGGIEPGVALARPSFGLTQGEETLEVVQPGRVFLRTYIGGKLLF